MGEKTQMAQQVIESPQAQKVVAGGTVVSGVGTLMEYIPALLGTSATIAGIILSVMMIRRANEDIKLSRMKQMHEQIEIELLKRHRDVLDIAKRSSKDM